MGYLTAFLVGLAGSIHCIGMCGPIALALPGHHATGFKMVFGRTLYNLGRTITYGFIGGLTGLLGQGLILAGTQQWVSIFTGILLILSVIIPLSISKRIQDLGLFTGLTGYVKNKLGKLLGAGERNSLILIGLLNGFLPCGLVYVALAGALNTGNAFNAMLYMVIFGLGTLPVMLAVSVFGKLINVSVRRKVSRVIPVFVFFLGVLFILRGMNLGIKYISPSLRHNTTTKEIMNCPAK